MTTNKKFLITAFLLLFSLALGVSAQEEIGVEVIEVARDVEAGTVAEYVITLTNFQGEADIYRINHDEFLVFPFSEFARSISINPPQVRLESLESESVNVSIRVLDTARQDRTYQTNFKVTSLTKPGLEKIFDVKTYVVLPQDIVLIFPEIPEEMNPGSKETVEIRFKNRGNSKLENYEILVSSDLPQLKKNVVVDFEPGEEIVEEIELDIDKSTRPGNYVINVRVYEDSETRGSYSSAFTILGTESVEEQIDEEKNFLSSRKRITRTNQGNIEAEQEIIVEKNIFSRLFTRTYPDPEVEDGNYIWRFALGPGEQRSIEYKVNYRPLLYGILIILIATLIMNFAIDRSVIIKKRVFKIRRTANGESEMKILVHVKNGKTRKIRSVRVLDVVPSVIEATEDFGTLPPTRVQHGTKGKRFIWELGDLAGHEERILSYKIKSKIHLVGDVKLPPVIVQYTTRTGKIKTERSAIIVVSPASKGPQHHE